PTDPVCALTNTRVKPSTTSSVSTRPSAIVHSRETKSVKRIPNTSTAFRTNAPLRIVCHMLLVSNRYGSVSTASPAVGGYHATQRAGKRLTCAPPQLESTKPVKIRAGHGTRPVLDGWTNSIRRPAVPEQRYGPLRSAIVC